MNWSRTLFKIVSLTAIGFVVPVAFLISLECLLSEIGDRPAWSDLLIRYLPPAIGCSLFFGASAITSSTPRRIVTFVQSLFLHVSVFIASILAILPTQHVKSAPQLGYLGLIPVAALLLVFIVLMVIGNIPVESKRNDLSLIADREPDRYDA